VGVLQNQKVNKICIVCNCAVYNHLNLLGHDRCYFCLAQSYEPGTYDLYTNNDTSRFAKEFVNGGELKPIAIQVQIASYAVSAALQGLSIYLVIIWSRQHNAQFNQASAQTQPSA
jgi:hypothetical protein